MCVVKILLLFILRFNLLHDFVPLHHDVINVLQGATVISPATDNFSHFK